MFFNGVDWTLKAIEKLVAGDFAREKAARKATK